ncbi:MAG: cupin domain-containing protein [Spirochaetes bacterium]|nr:cupin domain-containing protein [Spirochaetota bacterium]
MNLTDLENNTIFINGEKVDEISNIKWNNHPKFSGVFTKTLFTGKDSSNNLSAMIIKIEPNHEIGDHIHKGKYELHEIISGYGIGIVGDKKIEYKAGVVSLIPNDIRHSVKAGDNGIILLAKFTPPLN